MRSALFSITCAILILSGRASFAAGERAQGFQWLDHLPLKTLAERAVDEQKPLLLLFATEGCSHAANVVEAIDHSPELKAFLAANVLTARLDMNEQGGALLDRSPLLLANFFDLRGSPTLVLVEPFSGAVKRSLQFGKKLYINEGEIDALELLSDLRNSIRQ